MRDIMSMSSETELLKTNEFLRRRKLRLQQVREQSKDIAKKIRQRAKVEKLRQIGDLDSKKEQEYLQKQEKLVRRLEQLYAQGVKSVGDGHKRAEEEQLTDTSLKDDLSKLRGKEAVAELRRKKQEQLDKQKKLLDRKLLAREAANEISREKSSSVANKLLSKPSTSKLNEDDNVNAKEGPNDDIPKVTRSDMATQWDFEEELPNEWEPTVPALLLPTDKESVKESNNAAESKSDKSKRMDLFALSAEMPSSLRGGAQNVTEERPSLRPSLTLVSEYLQSRALRLRETDTTGSSKKQSDELSTIKQTILRSRSSKIEGTLPSTSVCHVADEQVIPVPSWQAESNCKFCTHSTQHHKQLTKSRHFTVTNSQINEIFSSVRSPWQDLRPSPVVRGSSPFRRSKFCQRNCKHAGKGSTVSSAVENNLTKKDSVTMYNHSTRDSRDMPRGDSRLVVRDLQTEEDAYSQALKESTTDHSKDREHQKKLQEMRNKVAMTKQTVEKEYMDTMSFLKSLPKEKCSKNAKNAYMDERRQRILKVSRQQKLQQEFNKIEKDCRKNCENARNKPSTAEKTRNKSKSPAKGDCEGDFESRDLQYSWMPVPESDGNLAIHTIPTTLKEGKTGNTVKFSKVDSYHEYRSRHKHTPPTKDTNANKNSAKKVVEKVIIHKDNDDSTDCSSICSDTSSVENLNIGNSQKASDAAMTEAERIVIYKILDKKEKERKKLKLIDDVAKVLKSMDKESLNKAASDNNNNKAEAVDKDAENRTPIDQIDEGVYRVVSEKGDNIASLCFTDGVKSQGRNIVLTGDEMKHGRPCCCGKKLNDSQKNDNGTNLTSGQDPSGIRTSCLECAHSPRSHRQSNIPTQPSAATSTSSFKTATTDKAHSALPDGGFIKFIDDDGQEAGKFYIGASGFLKDDAYEVIIQLRKKDTHKTEHEKQNIQTKIDVNVGEEEKVLTIHEMPNKTISELEKEKVRLPQIDKKNHSRNKCKKSPRVISQTSSPMLENNGDKESSDIDQDSSGGVSNVSSNEPIPNLESKKLVDKGVATSFQHSFSIPIPGNFPKTSDIPRPATSTYTQTTIDSPNQRPMFIHMSSSTSTAYMSPPEMVLPNLMRRDNYFQTDEPKINTRSENCENEKCARKRCKCHKTKSSASCRKISSVHKIVNPPPNTARDDTENEGIYDSEFAWIPPRRHDGKFHKCPSRAGSTSDNHRQNCRKNRHQPLHKISSRNLIMRVSSSTASSFKNKMNIVHSKRKINNTDLNPVIKQYVNKLLELNREGMKALEVANQECSSVSTPGSSIIEIPRNLNDNGSNIEKKLSLEQMKNMLKDKILEEYVKENTKNNSVQPLFNNQKSRTSLNKLLKRRSVHRVKSLNISKRILKTSKQTDAKHTIAPNMKAKPCISSPSSKDTKVNKAKLLKNSNETLVRSNSSTTSRKYNYVQNIESDISDNIEIKTRYSSRKSKPNSNNNYDRNMRQPKKVDEISIPSHRGTTTTPDSDFVLRRRKEDDSGFNISTQTSQDLDSEINLMKLAENKLHNMEKIADLTEKCTKRLSNLAKVLEEVRKNKSLAYSQISTSDTASDSEHKSEKNISSSNLVKQSCEPVSDVHDKTDPRLSTTMSTELEGKLSSSSEYVPFLTNIPKPAEFKYPDEQSIETIYTKSKQVPNSNIEGLPGKRREKPPPALSRIHLKHGQDVVPHELSTVVEVDSPMSVKLKNQSSTNSKSELPDKSYKTNNDYKNSIHDQKDFSNDILTSSNTEHRGNPDLLQSNITVLKPPNKISSTDSSDESKMQMMDLKQFNELMLKPFISIQEFAKQCGDVGALDDGSNLDDIPKDDGINDELSSLHSDGSLPDVIAELLKRNIITEPFKFETASNVNSTTVSSESMLSVLALSKIRKDKKKSSVVFENKENASETSESLSISSNPDLENAFKKLGMGWASSTLKKTKERLALSSSSNTSSSSLSQFKLKCLKDQDIPALVTDSMLSTTMLSSKRQQEKKSADSSRHAEQQTSFMNSMTVKEFLTNELAKKITFTNKSTRNNTEDEFVSLFETKMPEEMKNLSQSVRDERSLESVPSGQNNRARTSTPVQIFKSMTYHSSSSSNMSNGLFSNADDLSSVKVTSNSVRNHSTSDKDDLTIPNCSLKMRKGASDCSKSE